MEDTKKVNKSLRVLAEGYKSQFAENITESEAFVEFLMEQAMKFVDDNVCVIDDEEFRLELAMMLMECVKVGNF